MQQLDLPHIEPVSLETPVLHDIDTLAHSVITWHENKLATLKHLRDIPDGTTFSVDNSKEEILTGALLEGFKLGLDVSLIEIKDLPFYKEEIHDSSVIIS